MFLTTSLPACYLLTLLSLVSVRVFAQIEKTCYFPAGNVALNNVPCDPNAEVSSCCSDRSFCLANGLCRVENSDTELDDTVEFARGACTDQSFQDPACFQQCHSSQPGSPDSNGAAVFECGSTGFQNPAAYCCENGVDAKTACCATSSLLFSLGPGTFGSMSATPTPASPTFTSTSLSTTRAELFSLTLTSTATNNRGVTSASVSKSSEVTSAATAGRNGTATATGSATSATGNVTVSLAAASGVATAMANAREMPGWGVSLAVVGLAAGFGIAL